MDITDFSACRPARAKALIPFAVFLIFYVGISICAGSFYKVPMPIAFLVASAVALVLVVVMIFALVASMVMPYLA